MEDWDHGVCASAFSSSPNLTVLVTGAAGFLGTHVSLSLRHRGDCVIALDSFEQRSGEEEDESLLKLVQQLGPSNWTLISQSISGRTGKSCRLRQPSSYSDDSATQKLTDSFAQSPFSCLLQPRFFPATLQTIIAGARKSWIYAIFVQSSVDAAASSSLLGWGDGYYKVCEQD